MKFTGFISHNPTENAEQEENCDEEFLFNAIAQLAKVNGRMGRISEQSENINTASMHDTRTQTDTRQCKTKTNHSNLTLTANQINTANSEYKTYTHSKMMDNNNNRQNADRFTNGTKSSKENSSYQEDRTTPTEKIKRIEIRLRREPCHASWADISKISETESRKHSELKPKQFRKKPALRRPHKILN